ncbi:DUF1269 domain-containing protein [Nocardioides sp.]|uniref:DUF1269 domain-containing protein n=1 Tax=Nocardioides sp. TaxID=35761 RepID=UPI002ED0B737
MTAFTVWKFDNPDGAEHAVSLLQSAEGDDLVEILDHATVSWPVGDKKPKIRHGHEETLRGSGWGAFWGLLLGTLFTVPLLGIAAGAAIGGISKATEKLGITEQDLERIRDEITEGTSALFVVSDQGNLDRLGERFRGVDMTLVQTNLTPAERELLLETFGS